MRSVPLRATQIHSGLIGIYRSTLSSAIRETSVAPMTSKLLLQAISATNVSNGQGSPEQLDPMALHRRRQVIRGPAARGSRAET